MARYIREELLQDKIVTEETMRHAEDIGSVYLQSGMYAVFEWEYAPLFLRQVCCLNGGDEDWLVICKEEPNWFPRWLEKTDSGEEPDVYILKHMIVYVGSH